MRLHILKLHRDLHEEQSYDIFSAQWILDVSDVDDTSLNILISAGDVILIPDLLTGAGEFEGTYFVGNPSGPKNSAIRFPLHSGGIEYPEFPSDIASDLQADGKTLQSTYAELLDVMLQKVTGGPDSLGDVLGGTGEDVAEFWVDPPLYDIQSERAGEWLIPLRGCRVIESISFSSL